MKKRILISLELALILLAFVSSAKAHRPMWGESLGPIEVDDISTSYAFYQTLQQGEIEVFYFEGIKGDVLHVGIQIPDVNAYQEYGVSMALFGPGLPDADETLLPPEHPEDLGALIIENKITEDFFEPFTQTNYIGRQKLDITLPEDGLYYIIIWNRQNDSGKYVMDIGFKEQFGLVDFFIFPIWWLRVHWYFEHYLLVIGTLALFLSGFGFTARRFFAKKKG